MKLSSSHAIYGILVLILAFSGAAGALSLPIPEGMQLPAPRPLLALATFAFLLIVYGGLGLLGLYFSKKLCFNALPTDRPGRATVTPCRD